MSMKFKNALLKVLKNSEKFYYVFILSLILFSALSFPAFAAQPPKIVTGTVELFKTITTWLLLVIPVGAGAVLGFQALQKSLTDDQAVIAEKNKMMKNVIIGAAIAETASGLVTLILSFYQ